MSDAGLLVRIDGALLELELNRPAVANALDTPLQTALVDALIAARSNREVRAVVLHAAGRNFCGGADLSVIDGDTLRPGDTMARLAEGAQRVIASVLDSPLPVVAAVQGAAAGLGAHLALACDFVVMAESARLVSPFVARGIALDAGGAYLLTRHLPLASAKVHVLLGEDISAASALASGLAAACVPAEQCLETARGLARRLTAKPPMALALSKLQLNRALERDRDASFREEGLAQELAVASGEARVALAAFRRNAQ